MKNKELDFKTENSENIKQNNKRQFTLTMPNLDYKYKKRKYGLNYSKLKFKQNVLINILKKTNLRKKNNIHNTSKNTFIPKNTSLFYNFKLSYNINKKFHDLPGISNFHNITDEKINDLINSNDNEISLKPFTSQNILNMKANNNKKINNNLLNRRNNTPFFINTIINNGRNYNDRYKNSNNNCIINNKKNKKLSLDSKTINGNLNKININYTNNISNLKKKDEHINSRDTNSLLKSKKEIPIIHTISSEAKKIKLNKRNKLNNNLEIKKWLESIEKSIEKCDYFNRGSKVDRLLFYMVKPDECFEENLIDMKSGDKYLMLKKQIAKHKYKLENIIKDMKLNQIENEYLMKKYIFDLLSRKKDVY